MIHEDVVRAILKQFRLPAAQVNDPQTRAAAVELAGALAHFAELLPASERPTDAMELLEHAASTNAFEPLRVEQELPVTVVFYSGIHPAYYESEGRIGEPAWRLC